MRGRTLLAIGGDVTARAGFTVQLDPSAELDLLVGGQLIVTGGGTFGAAGAAARFRVWVASTTTVLFDGAPTVSGVIHAPAAPVTAPSGLPLSGSLLARSVAIGADSDLHFDRAILEAGTICGEPAAARRPLGRVRLRRSARSSGAVSYCAGPMAVSGTFRILAMVSSRSA